MGLKNKNNGGFSLIEMTIVIVVGSLILVTFADMTLSTQKNARIEVTKERLAAVDEALRLYYLSNYMLPCPARRNAPLDTANYGVETNCAAAAVAGETVDVVPFGGGAHRIRIGVVPTRTLNIPDSFGFDAWGGRILYAVNRLDTSTATFGNSPDNSIDIVDSVGNTVLGAGAGKIRFLTLSHGANKDGAFISSGTVPPGNACGTIGVEFDAQNCDDTNSTFLTTTVVSDRVGAGQYDDYVSYAGNLFKNQIPAGAVIPFNSAVCPQGWIDAGMAGRVALGTGALVTPAIPGSTAGALASPQNYALNSLAGSPQVEIDQFANYYVQTLPPYRALLYCEKI